MSSGPLKALTMSYLRGSVKPFRIEFEHGKKITIVYGENASGKTTICDALDLIGNSVLSSLEDRGLGRTRAYWPALGKTSADVDVILETEDSTCRARLRGDNVVVETAEQPPRVHLLRRKQLAGLIEARAGERYDAIRSFIDVSGIEESEKALRELCKELEDDRNTAATAISENRRGIEDYWHEAGAPAEDAVTWARAELGKGQAEGEAEIRSVDDLIQAHHQLAEATRRVDVATEALDEARAGAAEADAELLLQEQGLASTASDLLEVLQAGELFLERQSNVEACPLCESAERVAGLQTSIKERINSLQTLRAAKAAWAKARRTVETAVGRLSDVEADVSRHASTFEAALLSKELPGSIVRPPRPFPSSVRERERWLAETAELPTEWRGAVQEVRDRSRFLGALGRALATFDASVKEQHELDLLAPRLSQVLTTVIEERRSFTDEVLRGISRRVGELYELVHPGEGLDKISLELDPKRRASLSMSASFCGSLVPPQAYLSQSHLDTLGLCIVLALGELDCAEETILVLDDVLASVDEPHVDRLAEMLHGEASRFRHCVVTTHYKPWREKLRWGWLEAGTCQFVELTPWDEREGLRQVGSLHEVERLRALLAEESPNLQEVCAKAGFILEGALDFLTQLYECKVPRRPGGRHTLGDFLQGLDRKLRTALRVEVVREGEGGAGVYDSISLTGFIDELARVAQVRNVMGAHFNELAFQLPAADAIEFGNLVLKLMGVLTDGDNGWPRNRKSGSYWATSHETRRLHPLVRPE